MSSGATRTHQAGNLVEILFGPGAVPVDIHLGVPVELLAQLVQFLDAVVLHRIVPVVTTGQRCGKNFRHLGHVITGEAVVDVVRVALTAIGAGEALNFAGCLFQPLQFHGSFSFACSERSSTC